ncbi:MAG: signal peptidase I [Candidatus Shapirobacteria bacterium]|jgi:signal peptidase
MENLKQLGHYFLELGIWLIVIVVVIMGGLSFWSNSGMWKTKPWIVQSGSMEPTIMTGDIIFAVPQAKYFPNQIVTFRGQDGRVVTHRLIEQTGSDTSPSFITKGDANRTEDADQIRLTQIIGKVVFTIPKMGFVVAYTRTPAGLILMVVVPVTIVAYDEIRKMAQERKKLA